MKIGKTSSSISKTEIFEKYSEVQVVCTVFGLNSLPCRINSPFRVDNNPSFSIYVNDQHHVCFKDHGEKDTRGGLLDLLCKKWNCTFNQVFDKIIEVMEKNNCQEDSITIKPKQIKVLTRKEVADLQKIQVTVRPWKEHDLYYWRSYGIELPWLKYAEIYPISYKIITKKDSETSKSKKYIFPANKYTYCYVERKEGNLSLKIYSPFDQKHKWCSKMDASVISLWTKVPEYGDTIIIASSTKDALCISCNLHIPAIAPQGEGYNLSSTAVAELKRRYKHVFISYDGDAAGKTDAKSLAEKTGFSIIQCPTIDTSKVDKEEVKNLINEGLKKADKAKDWSDIFLYFGKERLIEEFNKALTNTLHDIEAY